MCGVTGLLLHDPTATEGTLAGTEMYVAIPLALIRVRLSCDSILSRQTVDSCLFSSFSISLSNSVEALSLLQHRGQDAAGVVTCGSGGRFYQVKSNGMVRDVFDTKAVSGLKGWMGVGHGEFGSSLCHSNHGFG